MGEVAISLVHCGQGGSIPGTLVARLKYPGNSGGEVGISQEH